MEQQKKDQGTDDVDEHALARFDYESPAAANQTLSEAEKTKKKPSGSRTEEGPASASRRS